MQPLQAGDPRAIGPYTLLGRLGAGGMGRVYLGRNAGGRTVAIKAVHPHYATDDQFRARFRREVDAARRVGGTWTAPVLDAGPEDEVPWVATGYVAGPSLSQAIADLGPLPEYTVRALGAGLGEALEAVHALGLVHRDVKPSNVLLTLDGPRLIDFGIARATDGTASLTASGVSVGSPGYMAPEQILGRGVTSASDVFSLGAVLVNAATGQPPFPGENAHVLLYQVVNEEPQFYGMNGRLLQLAAACLAKDPGRRPEPRALARAFAPEGNAASLVREGWLPQQVTDRISRRAVDLLSLESQPQPSGPVPLPPTDYPQQGFGPAPSFTPTPPPPPKRRAEFGWRSKRMSCTLVLSVAGALAGVTLMANVLGLMPGGGDGGGDSAGDTDAQTAEVPAAFLGSWEGAATSERGLPLGTVKVKITKGGIGDIVGRGDMTLQPVVCDITWKLTKVSDKELVMDSRAEASPPAFGCSEGSTEERLKLKKDGTLAYSAQDEAAGNPTGTLRPADD